MSENRYSALMYDPREMERKRKECIQACEPFHDMMYHILSRMPHPGMLLDLKTGEVKDMPISPEWQERIDFINNERESFIRSNYPELLQKQ